MMKDCKEVRTPYPRIYHSKPKFPVEFVPKFSPNKPCDILPPFMDGDVYYCTDVQNNSYIIMVSPDTIYYDGESLPLNKENRRLIYRMINRCGYVVMVNSVQSHLYGTFDRIAYDFKHSAFYNEFYVLRHDKYISELFSNENLADNNGNVND